MSNINPYQSPFAESEKPAALSPDLQRVVRNIRAICILYIVLGSIAALGGFVMLLFDDSGEIPKPIAGTIFVCAVGGVISALGVLRRQRWGVPFCQIISAIYLINFPIGTILGAYFLLNIGKVKREFR